MTTPVCADELRRLYDAIMKLQTGSRIAGINYGDRSVQYGPGQLKELQGIYNIFWRQCGADAGLPNLSASNMIERGPPAMLTTRLR